MWLGGSYEEGLNSCAESFSFKGSVQGLIDKFTKESSVVNQHFRVISVLRQKGYIEGNQRDEGW